MADQLTDLEIESAPPPKEDRLGRISRLAAELLAQEEEVERRTIELRRALDRYRVLADVELPQAMTEAGQSELKLLDGKKVKLEAKFIGTKLVNPVGLRWVEEHGGADLIKTSIVIELPASELAAARELVTRLRNDPLANRFARLELDQHVHNSTMGSFAKEKVEEGQNPPLDLLGVYRRSTAKVGTRRFSSVELKGFARKKLLEEE